MRPFARICGAVLDECAKFNREMVDTLIFVSQILHLSAPSEIDTPQVGLFSLWSPSLYLKRQDRLHQAIGCIFQTTKASIHGPAIVDSGVVWTSQRSPPFIVSFFFTRGALPVCPLRSLHTAVPTMPYLPLTQQIPLPLTRPSPPVSVPLQLTCSSTNEKLAMRFQNETSKRKGTNIS